jgi:hypothetical protein
MPFDVRGYQYQSDVDVLRKSAESGLAALAHEVRALEQQLEEYRRIGEFDGDRNEDGVVLWDREDLLSHEIAFACGALMELRKAFAIAAYHHWERSVQLWIVQTSEIAAPDSIDARRKRHARGYEDISKAASEIGYPADVELPRVAALANTLNPSYSPHSRDSLTGMGQTPEIA